jgi:predicted pyridoxine 5'-phosphate oxidase superfamily flavin-nucleotide-binding protein
MEESTGWETTITSELAAFIEAQESFFLATANAENQPYIQHRGGPRGFLKVLDEHTVGFADFAGNRQYITLGNLAENSKVHLFLIDYDQRRRVKIWGTASIIEGDAALIGRLKPQRYVARVEQVILIRVSAWDANCPQHIPRRIDATAAATAIAERDERIAALQADLERLRK